MNEKKTKDFSCPSCGVSLNVLISREAYKEKSTAEIPRTAEAVRKALPSDVIPDLTIVEKESTYNIVPKKFLGKENYWKVMQVVKNLHGEWVSQGKTSYWWVPKS
ncbi:hypothetical protein KAU88_10140 [Candidatus Bathyarchaeota archaeon]|nr:hypothetical protein [Candidatus Bathyarchaeota archaeon]